jgi:hypothetical protein
MTRTGSNKNETTPSKSRFSAWLCAKNQADLKGEILDRMNHFYLQTDGTYKWPNSAEGDLLKMAHKLISA